MNLINNVAVAPVLMAGWPSSAMAADLWPVRRRTAVLLHFQMKRPSRPRSRGALRVPRMNPALTRAPCGKVAATQRHGTFAGIEDALPEKGDGRA